MELKYRGTLLFHQNTKAECIYQDQMLRRPDGRPDGSWVGLIRVALLLYPPPTRPLGPLPDPYPIPRGYLIHTGQKIK